MPASVVVRSQAAAPAAAILRLPLDLLLKVLGGESGLITGLELHAAEAVCVDWRAALRLHGEPLYQTACRSEFGAPPPMAAPCKHGAWKQAYVQAYLQAKVDSLNSCQCSRAELEAQLEDLDELLMQATSVRAQLSASCGNDVASPDPIFLIVMDMEQNCMDKRAAAQQQLQCVQAQYDALQRELQDLRTRLPAYLA